MPQRGENFQQIADDYQSYIVPGQLPCMAFEIETHALSLQALLTGNIPASSDISLLLVRLKQLSESFMRQAHPSRVLTYVSRDRLVERRHLTP